MKFNKDANLGRMAYDQARKMRADLAKTQPKSTKGEQHVIYNSLHLHKHDSARNN